MHNGLLDSNKKKKQVNMKYKNDVSVKFCNVSSGLFPLNLKLYLADKSYVWHIKSYFV